MTGIESLTVMRDICRLDYEEGKGTMNWAVRALVGAALTEAPSAVAGSDQRAET